MDTPKSRVKSRVPRRPQNRRSGNHAGNPRAMCKHMARGPFPTEPVEKKGQQWPTDHHPVLLDKPPTEGTKMNPCRQPHPASDENECTECGGPGNLHRILCGAVSDLGDSVSGEAA